MSTVRVGIVDLDNSHPVAFAPILQRTEGLRITAVYDHGDVQPPAYVRHFAAEHGIETVCGSLAELVDAVDVGMVHSQNWDRHLERARPFLEAGKPIFLDKPVVGSFCDAQSLLELAERTKTPIMGGSALRFADEVVALRERRADLGRIYSAFLCGPGDAFNIGSHIVALAGGFFRAEVEAVTALGPVGEAGTRPESPFGQAGDVLFLIEQHAEPDLILQLSAGTGYADSPAYLALATERGMQIVAPRSAGVGPALMREFTRFCLTGRAPVPFAEVVNDALVLLMAAESLRTGRRVTLSDLPPDAGFDGAAFTAEFARGGGFKGRGLLEAHARYEIR